MGLCTGIRLGKFTVTPLSRGFEGKPVGYVVRAFRTGCALDILLEPFPFLRSVRTLGQAWLRVNRSGWSPMRSWSGRSGLAIAPVAGSRIGSSVATP